MTLEVHDRVKETTTTTGSSDAYALGGAVTGFETFGSHLGDADTTYYVCTDGTNFEIGRGTYSSSGNTLARTAVLASSNSGNDNAHSWAAGTKEIFITYPASKAVFKDASDNINGTFVGNITGNVTGNTSGSSGSTTGNAATATALQTARAINGTNFDGTGDITVTAAAGTLTGSTLNSGVTASSLTSLGTLASDLNMGGQDVINAGVSSADTHAGIYGSLGSPVIFTVTVASQTTAHPYYGNGSSSKYYINGVESPALTLHGVDNVTLNSEYYYRFDQSDSSNSTHPLAFYLDADKTTAYTTGVTTNGTPGSSGAYTQIAVDEDTPNILYYQCSSHAYMGNHAIVLGSNKINHTEALISFPTTTGTLVGTGDTGSVSNTMLAGSIAASKLGDLLKTDIKIGEDDETKIDFETANEIHFYASNVEQVYLADNIFGPQSDSDVDLGTTGVRWKDAYLDSVTVTDNVTIGGNLTVNGTTTTIDTTNTVVKDSLLGLNNGASSNSNDSGIIIERGSTGNDALLIWDESADKWALGTTTDNASSTGNLNMTTGTLVANIEGNVTGNVTGNVSGSSGSTTGNAATATALATGRTIAMTGDVVWTSASFDGSGNVTGSATIQSNAVETSMINADAVTGAKIADDAIDSEHYTDGSIDTAHIAADAITGAKIADDAINSEHYTDGSIDTAHIADDQVTQAKIADDAVGADQLASNAVVNASVASGAAIDATKIHDGTISNTEFGYLNNVSSNIQTQLDAKASAGFALAMAICL